MATERNLVLADPYYQRLLELERELMLPAVAPDPALVHRLVSQAETTAAYDGPAGVVVDARPAAPVPVRVYRPEQASGPLPLLVWCHGGGWARGDLDIPEADATAREVAARTPAVVLSVAYRLAVEGRHYPEPLHDVVAAFSWAREHAAALGSDSSVVSLGGASAGANLAAAAALLLRDQNRPLPASLVLIYPVLHARLPEPSPELAGKVARLTPLLAFAPAVLTTLIENYAGARLDQAGPYVSPGDLALHGLPPTLVVNAEFDGLRASGEHFTREARSAGVDVTELLAPDVVHGHLNAPHLPQTQTTYEDIAGFLRQQPEG